ncbi:MAG TPA: hypothetical protein VKV39_11215 [Candidatus Sulfotelmatobacter sp.]|nr:hypothetical protein [Candidatus Sulfotelmatobacter sp.]
MFKLVSALALVLCLGTAGLIAGNPKPNQAEAQLAADGAFRDGLYQGRLAAQNGRSSQPKTGRWSTKQDRASFAAGYSRGYTDTLASNKTEQARTE